jgi:hypothetical protein
MSLGLNASGVVKPETPREGISDGAGCYRNHFGGPRRDDILLLGKGRLLLGMGFPNCSARVS